MAEAPPVNGLARSRWRRDALRVGLVAAVVLLVVYLALVVDTRRLTLLGPRVPKPHVVARFTGTIVVLSEDSTEGCVTRSGHQGRLCSSIYAHQPLSLGQRIPMVEVVVPLGHDIVTTVLVINPTS